jgi:hypothetical protein
MTTTTQGNIFSALDPENMNTQNSKKKASKTPKVTQAEGQQNKEPLIEGGEGGAFETVSPQAKSKVQKRTSGPLDNFDLKIGESQR